MLFLSVVTIGEIRRGLVLLPQGRRRVELETWFHTDMLAWFRDRILPVTHSIADRWGMLDGLSQLRGTPLEMADGMIAATSLEHDLTVVSRNVRDFARLGLGLTSSEGAASEITRLSFRQTSMLTQRLHRIDIRGATSRQTQRDSGNQGEQQRDSDKGN